VSSRQAVCRQALKFGSAWQAATYAASVGRGTRLMLGEPTPNKPWAGFDWHPWNPSF